MVASFKGRKVFGGKAQGEALVVDDLISLRSGIDVKTGRVIQIGHPLQGKTLANRVLVFASDHPLAGEVVSLALEAIENAVGPCAIVSRADQIAARGGVAWQIPVLAGVKPDPIAGITTGDLLEVDADAGRITILNRYTE